jgi:hypothetical protein
MDDALTERLVARAIAANARRMCRQSREASAEHIKLMHEGISRSREVLQGIPPQDAFAGRNSHEPPTSESHVQQAGCIDQGEKPAP